MLSTYIFAYIASFLNNKRQEQCTVFLRGIQIQIPSFQKTSSEN